MKLLKLKEKSSQSFQPKVYDVLCSFFSPFINLVFAIYLDFLISSMQMDIFMKSKLCLRVSLRSPPPVHWACVRVYQLSQLIVRAQTEQGHCRKGGRVGKGSTQFSQVFRNFTFHHLIDSKNRNSRELFLSMYSLVTFFSTDGH